MNIIVPMILNEIRDHLTTVMITNVTVGDPTRATDVDIGRFQDDKIMNNIHIAISGGDPDNPKTKDGIVTLEEMHNIGMKPISREIGGGQYWWRRGVVQIGCYFINQQFERDVARQYAYEVLARVENNMESIRFSSVDDYGERAIRLYVYANTFHESGGPPNSYIWRGAVNWACLTGRV